MNTLECNCWLVVEKGGKSWRGIRVYRVTAKKPSVGPRQVAIRVELSLPDALFSEPQIVARISLDGDVSPAEISADTVAGVESALRGAGFVVRVTNEDQQP